jgi:hypothetical protein
MDYPASVARIMRRRQPLGEIVMKGLFLAAVLIAAGTTSAQAITLVEAIRDGYEVRAASMAGLQTLFIVLQKEKTVVVCEMEGNKPCRLFR